MWLRSPSFPPEISPSSCPVSNLNYCRGKLFKRCPGTDPGYLQSPVCNPSVTVHPKGTTSLGQQRRAFSSPALGLSPSVPPVSAVGESPGLLGGQPTFSASPLSFPRASRGHTAALALALGGKGIVPRQYQPQQKRLHASVAGAGVMGSPKEGGMVPAMDSAEVFGDRAASPTGMAQGAAAAEAAQIQKARRMALRVPATADSLEAQAAHGMAQGIPAESDRVSLRTGEEAEPASPQAELRHSPGPPASMHCTNDQGSGAACPPATEPYSASAQGEDSRGSEQTASMPPLSQPQTESRPSPGAAAQGNESQGAEGSAWRRHVASLAQGTRWVGPLDPMVEEVLHEVVGIEEHFLSEGHTWRRATAPFGQGGKGGEGPGREGEGEKASLTQGHTQHHASVLGSSDTEQGGQGAERAGHRVQRQGPQGGGKKRRGEQREAVVSQEDDFYEGPVSEELDRRFRERYANAQAKGGEFLHRSFAARQVATKLLLTLPELCHGCWLPHEDCMCAEVKHVALPNNIVLWVYLHPKEFLLKNNTGKLLWQVLGPNGARLCISGIKTHEDAMFDALLGGGTFWCLYPARGGKPYTAASIALPWASQGAPPGSASNTEQEPTAGGPTHFLIVDGTWNTSRAMVTRLQEQLELRDPKAWLNFVQLAEPGPSVMHNLRIQPTKEKICTAAAASQLLVELSERPDLPQEGAQLCQASKAIDSALAQLLNALAKRRMRTGLTGTRLGVGSKNHGYLQDRKRY